METEDEKMKLPGKSPPSASRPPLLADWLADQLLADIDANKFHPGDRLPTEQEISAQYRVSRPTVREAVGRLKQKGVVQSRQGVGSFVSLTRPLQAFDLAIPNLQDKSEIQNILEVLESIESSAAAYAAARRTDSQLQLIKHYLDEMQRAIDKDEAGVEEDFNFHTAIAEASGNPMFSEITDFFDKRVRRLIRVARSNSARRLRATRTVQKEHTEIYKAIAKKDSQAARLASSNHLVNAGNRLQLYLTPPTNESQDQSDI